MFIALLLSNLCVSVLVCIVTLVLFRALTVKYLQGRFEEPGASVWGRYMMFFIFIAGISVGTRIWEMESYLEGGKAAALTGDRMALEIFMTFMATLQINAFMLLLFLLFVWIGGIIRKKA